MGWGEDEGQDLSVTQRLRFVCMGLGRESLSASVTF